MCTRSDNPVKENSGRPIPFRPTSDTSSYVRELDFTCNSCIPSCLHQVHHCVDDRHSTSKSCGTMKRVAVLQGVRPTLK
ncbi:predicted protein [Lichtheimia corymbifera JMRC:FSU:9682]|uniref:Uncharacterized protein n=1 Tax=Lichtheimia corymbifera JMRC:FSU:9682 TaxID=1263082 RepID=A0A068RTH8_9FUNG|nr:predicted protein [Lichtheimia corymbifera JMRC:FSU:9682]